MAKAKKSEKSEKPAKKAPAKKVAAKKPPPMAGGMMVDTGLAAQNAARLLAAGLSLKSSAPAKSSNESSVFKNLKENLAKPHLSGLDSILDKSAPADTKRSNLPFGGGKQVAHNQTTGADATRTGVPRRTPG